MFFAALRGPKGFHHGPLWIRRCSSRPFACLLKPTVSVSCLQSPCPKALMIQHGERCFSLLAFGRSGLFGPPLCGGSAPATPPLLQPRVVASGWAIRRCRPVSAHATPRQLADSENVPPPARQARPLPYLPNVHRHDHREPATETLTVHSPHADRTQNMAW